MVIKETAKKRDREKRYIDRERHTRKRNKKDRKKKVKRKRRKKFHNIDLRRDNASSKKPTRF